MYDYEPIRTECPQGIHYTDLAEYIRSWPDKLVSFVVTRLLDDDFRPFAQELQEYVCEADRDGPDFEKWRNT